MRSRSVVLPATASVLPIPEIEGASAVSAYAMSHSPGDPAGPNLHAAVLHAEVLHVFSSGFYLGVDVPHRSGRLLLPVMGSTAMQLPFGVVVPELGTEQIGSLRTGMLARVSLRGPLPTSASPVSLRRIEIAGISVTIDIVREHRPLRLRAEQWPSVDARRLTAVAERLRPGAAELPRLAHALASALLALDETGTEAAARQLIGHGPGSTPSGDDALCGIALALNLTAGTSQLRLLSHTLDEVGIGDMTPTLSAALVSAAVSGHCVPEVAEAVRACHALLNAPAIESTAETSIESTPQAVTAPAAEGSLVGKVLSPLDRIGHTSGHDVFTGFLAMLACGEAPQTRPLTPSHSLISEVVSRPHVLTPPPHSLTSH